jgi:predicted DNA-binding transcriptional regulator YafY
MTTREQRAQEVEQSAQIMFAHLGGGEWAEIEEWRRENFRQAANEVLAYSKAEVPEGDAATIYYRNHRGELATRRILPQRMWFGSTKWHPEPQWLLDAHDLDKGVLRSFALRDMLPAHVEADDETVERVARAIYETRPLHTHLENDGVIEESFEIKWEHMTGAQAMYIEMAAAALRALGKDGQG